MASPYNQKPMKLGAGPPCNKLLAISSPAIKNLEVVTAIVLYTGIFPMDLLSADQLQLEQKVEMYVKNI